MLKRLIIASLICLGLLFTTQTGFSASADCATLSQNPRVQYYCKRFGYVSVAPTNYWIDFEQIETIK